MKTIAKIHNNTQSFLQSEDIQNVTYATKHALIAMAVLFSANAIAGVL